MIRLGHKLRIGDPRDYPLERAANDWPGRLLALRLFEGHSVDSNASLRLIQLLRDVVLGGWR